METLHEITSPAKVIVLAAHIRRHGWQGAPLVVDGDQLITGVHRYAACKLIGMLNSEIPMIELSDVFAEAGMEITELLDGDTDIDDVAWAISQLPTAIRDQYGLDIH